jgi:hypothetical protein
MGVCAAENSMLFNLDIIISLTKITGRGGGSMLRSHNAQVMKDVQCAVSNGQHCE